jgi:hypothetical protein
MMKNKTKPEYQVIVGNVGTVYSGTDRAEADRDYSIYAEMSDAGQGRAGDEPVTLTEDGEPVRENGNANA